MRPDGFIGQKCISRPVGGFTLTHWLTDFSNGIPPGHGHAEAHFMYVPGSTPYVTQARGEIATNGANLIFNPEQTYHSDHLTGPGRFFSIAFSMAMTETLRELQTPGSPVQMGHPRAHLIVAGLTRACMNWSADAAPRAESLCLELIATLIRPPGRGRKPKWLARAIEIMQSEYRHNISVQDIAARVGVHSVHLSRTFREHMGCSPGDYLQDLRVQRAAVMLNGTKMRIPEIALATGFADQSHFTKQFRRFFTVPPGEYRRRTTM